jgi:hypothetical protein
MPNYIFKCRVYPRRDDFLITLFTFATQNDLHRTVACASQRTDSDIKCSHPIVSCEDVPGESLTVMLISIVPGGFPSYCPTMQ